jgi:2-oxo-hept-3-ene-1,7-dioate hydratase
MNRSIARTALLLAAPTFATAACPDEAEVRTYVADFAVPRANQTFATGLTLADAECARAKLVSALPEILGRVVGYKAGFTNPAVQARVGVKSPAWGVMFAGQMFESGARIPVGFGARPQYEADLIAVVKDDGLAAADTPLKALAHLSAVMPFIELPDLMCDGPLKGIDAIARNITFRGGVLGPRVEVEPSQAFLDALADMSVVMEENGSGKELGRSKGDALMGHPIRAVMWLAASLEKEGIRLEPGDLLSLGGYIPLAPVQPGTSITVRYLGLPGDPSVTAHFEDR